MSSSTRSRTARSRAAKGKLARAVLPKTRGAIYARYSTGFQGSIPDQVRACQEWAIKNGVTVLEQHIFSDADTSGQKQSRPGLDALLKALANAEVDVVITLSFSRLYRNLRGSLKFIDESIRGLKKRFVCINENLDSAQPAGWRAMTVMHGLFSEMTLSSTTESIKAGQVGLAVKNLVHGTLPFGYRGIEVVGTPTQRNCPRRAIEIDPETAPVVERIFKLYAYEGMSFHAIARLLRRENAPPPAKAKVWSWRCVKRAIINLRYVGDWSYGRTENVWQSKADYSRQFEREEGPHTEHFDEKLRIISDTLFDDANEKLERDLRGGRGKARKNRCGEDLVEPLRGLLSCPKHGPEHFRKGGTGEWMYCYACKSGDEPPALYSTLNRITARRVIADALLKCFQADASTFERMIGQRTRQRGI